MNSGESGSTSPVSLSLERNERLLTELRQLAGHNPHTTSGRNPILVASPPTETPFEIDGQEHAARLFNLSLGGGKLATDHKPSVGSLIRIGRITARVADHFQDGIAIEFVDIED